MNVITFTGNCGADGEVRSAGNDKVLNFNVAVKQGFGRDAPTSWYRVEVWGKRGESLAQHIHKGGKVAVTGEFIIDEYQGKPQYRVRAYDIDPFMGAREGGGAAARRPDPATSGFPTNDAYPVDLDDGREIPF